MTSPQIRPRRRLGGDSESFADWYLSHRREVTWGLLAVVILVGGLWFYDRSRNLRQQNAERAYFQARQAAASGNVAQAIADLRKVTTRYEGTRAGTQAALFLAQGLYDQKKYKEGIAELKKVEAKAGDFAPSVHSLAAAGHEELQDFNAAAAEYRAASTKTKFPAEKAKFLALAARSLMAAGKPAEARTIWKELADDETGPMAAEARVRLGEVEAKPLKI